MDFFTDIFKNQFLMTGMTSWLLAQIIKMIINLCTHNGFKLRNLFADGGMPSGHSATISSLATSLALVLGTKSPEFAIAFILTVIICNDAAGVRFETGQQSILLNQIVKSFEDISQNKLPEIHLKELVGHTKLQVFCGILLGIANACFMNFVVFANLA
ncbi:MAG: divergent PAP2 family protein [Oscillospiraceae bacterium]|nr:divergent PAP2 family protein [Oscillospiraceae bacterium]